MTNELKKIILAGGCFWCTEAVFQRLKGVESVISGYSGGEKPNPSYEEVCSGNSGHAEAIQITYNPKVISYNDLLNVFFHLHDPTTLNKQGNDTGTQYRSAIFYDSAEQKKLSETKIKELTDADQFHGRPIVTTLEKFTEFYPAESYHRDYYNKNSYQPYCSIIIDPKIKKLYKEYKELVKEGSTQSS